MKPPCTMRPSTSMSPWCKYHVYKDISRFEYGRLLWKNPSVRQRMLAHWSDSKHSYHHSFLENQETIEEVLGSQSSAEKLDERFVKKKPQPSGSCQRNSTCVGLHLKKYFITRCICHPFQHIHSSDRMSGNRLVSPRHAGVALD